MTITEAQVQAAVRELEAKLDGLRPHDLVTFFPRDAGYPHIEVRDGEAHWIVTERGRELQHRTTRELDEALYWVALDATFALALRWEQAQRSRFPAGRDTRIGWLAKQVDLLRGLDADWAARFRAGIPTKCPGVRLADVDAHPLT